VVKIAPSGLKSEGSSNLAGTSTDFPQAVEAPSWAVFLHLHPHLTVEPGEAAAVADAIVGQGQGRLLLAGVEVGENECLINGHKVLGAHLGAAGEQEGNGGGPFAAELVQPPDIALGQAALGKSVGEKELPLRDGRSRLGQILGRQRATKFLPAGQGEIGVFEIP